MKRLPLVSAIIALSVVLSGCEALQAQKGASAAPATPAAAPGQAAQNAAPTQPKTAPVAQAAPAVSAAAPSATQAAAAPNAPVNPNTAQQQQAAAAGQHQGMPVFFLLAQPEKAAGLNEMKLKDGALWFLPKPALSRADLTRVTPLNGKDGRGVIRFDFNPAGAQKLATVSQRFQGKFLVLVVGNQVEAVPRIAGPMKQGALFIVVPTVAQAQTIARAIAGNPQ